MNRIPLLLVIAVLFQSQPTPAWQERLEKSAASPETWKQRKAEIRTQILVAAGLWPEFDRPALKPVVFGKTEGDGYSIEKVRFETFPGFHLTGNLYRPVGKQGPFPCVASPHGHWKEGRFVQNPMCDIPARGITLARLGFVVFAYDMVGFGDFKQLPHSFDNPAWGIGLLGLQTWNSLRAVDFLTSLPDVDPRRVGCTGASGGGTQTFLLAAVDDRITCSVPVNMLAAEFQGGCSCENAPFLRLGLNNVELAAVAPRPLLLISATGDWTKSVPVLEGPVLQRAYKALGVEERFKVVQIDAPHNYNRKSREAVYAWFVRWLQNGPAQERIAEPDVPAVKREDLAVYSDGKAPEGSVDAEGLKKILRERIQAQLEALRPKDGDSLRRFRELMGPAFRVSLAARWPEGGGAGKTKATLFVLSEGKELKGELGTGEFKVILPDSFAEEAPSGGTKEQRKDYPATFYRTKLARQVQAILDKAAEISPGGEIRLVGMGEAGVPVLLARTLVPGATVVDLQGQGGADEAFWSGARSHPGMLRLGGLSTAAMLAAPGRLILHNTQGRFESSGVLQAYHAAGADAAVTVSETEWTLERIREALQ